MPWVILAKYHLAGLRPALSNSIRINFGVAIIYSHVPLTSCQNSSLFILAMAYMALDSCKFVIVSVAIIQGLSIMVGIQLVSAASLSACHR
jgi:hypothetical protein